RGVGRTFQIPRPFRKLSLIENVALAAYYGTGAISRAQAWRQAEEVLDLVGLPSTPGATPSGLGTAALKKLELARALASKPKLLLADESLGGLDATEKEPRASLPQNLPTPQRVTNIW